MKTSKISSHLPCLLLVLGAFGLGYWLNEWKNQRVMEAEVAKHLESAIRWAVKEGYLVVGDRE
jgi:hypothetical protein